MSAQPREQWATKTGFVLAAVGSAVGLGNMWRFSYLTAEHGGAAFILLYAIMLVFIGLPVLLAEFAAGRATKESPILAFALIGGPRWRPLGYLFVITGFLILAYYSVIAGWVVRYTGLAVLEGFTGDLGSQQELFLGLATGPVAIAFHLGFMVVTVAIVALGIKRGIERAAIVLMPLLFITVAGLAAYAATLDGEGVRAAYAFYLRPDFESLLSLDVLRAAAGQAFFSLSLGMGVMITYASYLSRENNMPRESLAVAGTDSLVALVAGLMVFPFIFVFGVGVAAPIEETIGESTVGALFMAVPAALAQMGPAGPVIGVLFFGVLLIGALTSAISLLEVVVASAIDTLGWSRRKASVVAGAAIAAVGLPAAFTLVALEFMDALAGSFFLVLGAMLVAVLVGWRMGGAEEEIRKGAGAIRWAPVWRWFLRLVVPPVLVVLLISSVEGLWDKALAVLRELGLLGG